MAFLDLLRQLLHNDETNEATLATRGVDLREALNDDPNNIEAFTELGDVVREAAASRSVVEDPLTADVAQTPEEIANLALWSLAEELSAKPSAWYPLIELARLSVDQDHEGAIRRLTTAVQRDDSGLALAEAVKVLRGAEQPDAAVALGIGHWVPQNHAFEAGEQIIMAALDAGRPEVARIQYDTLADATSGEKERLGFINSLIEKDEN